MNKNIEVLSCDYDSDNGKFLKIYEVYDIKFAPYILVSHYDESDIDNEEFRKSLSNWFNGRGIPSWRDKLDLLLHRLNVEAPSELLDKAFGLSLSDQYWLKPYDTDICYDDINFFDNDFDYSEFLEASFSKNSMTTVDKKSLMTPNNTTDGMLKKAWIIEDGTRYLLKSGYKKDMLQPFNEVLASEISRRLGFDYIGYTLDTYKDTIVSKCPCFITKDTELITCYQIKHNTKKYNNDEDYEEYIKILENNGISDARVQMENMYILDFLIMNEDRHLNNFGIIRDVNTLKWIKCAPIFDNGQGLNIIYFDEEEMHISGEGRFFYEIKPFDDIISVVRDFKRINIDALDGIDDWFYTLLHQYQDISHFSESRINKLCMLLNRQVSKLRDIIKNI